MFNLFRKKHASSGKKKIQTSEPGPLNDRTQNINVSKSRRGFFVKAALGGATLGGVATVASVIDSSATDKTSKRSFDAYLEKGDQVLQQKEHFLMSDDEKEEMLHELIGSHGDSK